FFLQAEDGIRDFHVTGVQTCALPISLEPILCRVVVDRLLTRRHETCVEGNRGTVIGDNNLVLLGETTIGVAQVVEENRFVMIRQIGRASWRERVEMAGEGGSGKTTRS